MIVPRPTGAEKYAPAPKTILLYVQGIQTPVATLNTATGVLFKAVSEKHVVQKPHRSIAFDVNVIEQALKLGGKTLRVTHRETGEVFTTTIETFQKKGYRCDRRFGNQWALGLFYWSINGRQPEAERKAEEEAQRAETADMKQLDMFGGLR